MQKNGTSRKVKDDVNVGSQDDDKGIVLPEQSASRNDHNEQSLLDLLHAELWVMSPLARIALGCLGVSVALGVGVGSTSGWTLGALIGVYAGIMLLITLAIMALIFKDPPKK